MFQEGGGALPAPARWRTPPALVGALLGLVGPMLALAPSAAADPALVDPFRARLELVTPDPAEQAKLSEIDGLAFDALGNLFGALEITGPDGGVVAIDVETGAVTVLETGIDRADQIAFHPSGDFYVTSESSPASTTNRLYRLSVSYAGDGTPLAGSRAAVTTSAALDHPEGLVVLPSSGAYGSLGDLYVGEDLLGGGVFFVDSSDGTTLPLVTGLARPEGMAFGDFAGRTAPGLFAAVTLDDEVVRIAADGQTSVVGAPAAVGLTRPDNLEFGPDGFLYVSEDRAPPDGRIIRIAADGSHEVFATGFAEPQGMVFDPSTGDLFIAEQGLRRVWRVRFALPLPALGAPALGLLTVAICATARAASSTRG